MSVSAATITKEPSPLHQHLDASRPVRQAALIAGFGLLAMTGIAIFANFVVLNQLITDGDAARTASEIVASRGLFQLGIAGWFLIVGLDVLVAWALFRVLRPVSRRLAALSAWARVLYATVLGVAVLHLMEALRLLSDQAGSAVSRSALQLQALHQTEAFTDVWNAGLVLFGVHLLLVGYLAYRSGYVPKLIGVLVWIAGFGYLFDAAATVLVRDPAVTLSVLTGLGEFALAVWLVARGRRITFADTIHLEDRTAATQIRAVEPPLARTQPGS